LLIKLLITCGIIVNLDFEKETFTGWKRPTLFME